MLQYKEMKLADIKEMTQMYIETFNAAPWKDEWTKETVEKRLHQMINVEDFYGICAYSEGKLCGMVLGSKEQYFDGMRFHLKEFCVDNHSRGQGIGSQILEEFEKRLKEQGIGKIVLLTSKHEHTEKFYRQRGFLSCEEMVLMEKAKI